MEALLVALSAALVDAPTEALRATLPLWSVVQVPERALLWKQGRPADALAMVHVGALDMVIHGTVIGEIGPGQMIGEPVLCDPEAPRFASMHARALTQVLALHSVSVARLRDEHSPVYDAIVRRAIVGAAQRGQTFDRRLAQVRKGNFAAPLAPASAGLLTRLWRRVARPAPDPADCPPLAGLLARNPVLARAGADVIAAIVPGFTPCPFRAGEVLTRQDEVDTRVFVLAAGQADVLRSVDEEGGALLLGRIEPGTIFGVNAFISGSERTASILATSDGWAYAMSREHFERLSPAARTAWLEVTLANFVRQYQEAAKGLQVAIRAFASHHDEMLPSRLMSVSAILPPGDPDRPLKTGRPRKRR